MEDFISDKLKCKCFEPPFSAVNFESLSLGSDENYGEVSIEKCKICGQKWLHYFYENEAFTKSGRWYRGLISEKDLTQITLNNAVAYLENLTWHIRGGSYFETLGNYVNGNTKIGKNL